MDSFPLYQRRPDSDVRLPKANMTPEENIYAFLQNM